MNIYTYVIWNLNSVIFPVDQINEENQNKKHFVTAYIYIWVCWPNT